MKAYFLYKNNKVNFTLIPGEYKNIMVFLESHNISFLSEIMLNFDNIPILLHGNGNGNSKNLIEFLSKNKHNTLIKNFLNIINVCYSSSQKLNFMLDGETNWQNIKINIKNPYTPTTTITTTQNDFFILTINGNNIMTLNGDLLISI